MPINKNQNPIGAPIAKLLKATLKDSGRIISGEYEGRHFITNGTFLTLFTIESDWKDILLECKLEPRHGTYQFASWSDKVPDVTQIMATAEKATKGEWLKATIYRNNSHYHLFSSQGEVYAFDEQFLPLWETFTIEQNRTMLKAYDSRYWSIVLAVRNLDNSENTYTNELKKLVESLQAPV